MHQTSLRRFAISVAAVAGLALGSLLIAAPAQACDAAKQCGYSGSNYAGSVYMQKFSNADLSANTTFNDTFSSLRNSKTVAACYYTNTYYTGLHYPLSAGYIVAALNSSYDNQFSSLKSC